MKFLPTLALMALVNAVRIETLPDVRADLVADADIAAHEAARKDAAKVKKNPNQSLIDTLKADMTEINNDMSFGVSFSQKARNDHAVGLC